MYNIARDRIFQKPNNELGLEGNRASNEQTKNSEK